MISIDSYSHQASHHIPRVVQRFIQSAQPQIECHCFCFEQLFFRTSWVLIYFCHCPRMTSILFPIISVDFHRTVGKRTTKPASVDISPSNSWPPPSQIFDAINSRLQHSFFCGTLCQFKSLESPPGSKTGAITGRKIYHSPKIVTAHLFSYLVDEGIAFRVTRRVLRKPLLAS